MASRDPRLKRLRSRAEDQAIAGQRVGRTPERAGMSAVLAQPEMATRRLDWVADDAVPIEPVFALSIAAIREFCREFCDSLA